MALRRERERAHADADRQAMARDPAKTGLVQDEDRMLGHQRAGPLPWQFALDGTNRSLRA